MPKYGRGQYARSVFVGAAIDRAGLDEFFNSIRDYGARMTYSGYAGTATIAIDIPVRRRPDRRRDRTRRIYLHTGHDSIEVVYQPRALRDFRCYREDYDRLVDEVVVDTDPGKSSKGKLRLLK